MRPSAVQRCLSVSASLRWCAAVVTLVLAVVAVVTIFHPFVTVFTVVPGKTWVYAEVDQGELRVQWNNTGWTPEAYFRPWTPSPTAPMRAFMDNSGSPTVINVRAIFPDVRLRFGILVLLAAAAGGVTSWCFAARRKLCVGVCRACRYPLGESQVCPECGRVSRAAKA